MSQLACPVCEAPMSTFSKFCGACGAPCPEPDDVLRKTHYAVDDRAVAETDEWQASAASGPIWSTGDEARAASDPQPPPDQPGDSPLAKPQPTMAGPMPTSPFAPARQQGGGLAAVPSVVAPALTIGAPILLLCLTLLNWYDFNGFGASFWRASSGGDIVLLLFAIASMVASAGVLATGLGAARLAAGGLGLLVAGMALQLIAEAVLSGNGSFGSLLAIPVSLALLAGSALHLTQLAGISALTQAHDAVVPGLGTIVGATDSHPRSPFDQPREQGRSPFGPVAAPTPAPDSPLPGWYPDPSGRFEQRRWDGARWTQDTR